MTIVAPTPGRWIHGAVLCLALGGCGSDDARVASDGAVAAPKIDWRTVATTQDRGRLRGWRGAWISALAQVPGSLVAREPVLFNPDRSLPGAVPPAGAYRCRTFKLGARSGAGPVYTAYGWFACRIGLDETGALRIAKLTGSQRPSGRIYSDSDMRAVFLGTMQLGDETVPISYGRDASRDMAGLIERIGPRRWRIVLPYPKFESVLDVVEIVPAAG